MSYEKLEPSLYESKIKQTVMKHLFIIWKSMIVTLNVTYDLSSLKKTFIPMFLKVGGFLDT